MRPLFRPIARFLALSLPLWGLGACGNATTPPAETAVDDAAADVAAADGALAETAGADATPELPESDGAAVDATGFDWPNHDCDPIHPVHCALPWPSNQYLVPDAKTKTGYRLQFGETTLPKNSGDQQIEPGPYAFLDGYGVGTAILMAWPDIDLSGLPSEATMDKSVDPAAAIVLLEVENGKVTRHVPYFVELDATEKKKPAHAMTIVRPALILKEATRYVVGVRGLKDKAGKPFTAAPAFALLQSGKTAGTAIADRQAHFDDIFQLLGTEKIKKEELILAWDFVTASSETEHGRLLAMRDAAQKQTGASGPLLTVKEVRTLTPAEDVDIGMEITGTFHVPSYMRYDAKIGLHYLNLDAAGLPQQDGSRDPEFYVRIPRSALGGGGAHGLMQYGHGLNGHAGEVGSGYLGGMANQNKLILYACHLYGMSQFEVAEILIMLTNMTWFPTLPDKLHQGLLEYTLLQRAMREQFADLPAVKQAGITVDKSKMYYYGNSQGGIFGGTVLALSTDITRGALGVVGNNYSTLLQRSSDFEQFFALIRGYYPDSRDQIILLSAIQLLWDAADPVTHYAHLHASPYPGTPAHEALADIAIGDHQVAPITMENAARSGNAFAIMANWGKPVFGVTPTAYPFKGSGIVSFNCGNDWVAQGNLPPTQGEDPHGCPRKRPEHWQQMGHFFATGEIIDVCGGKPCVFPK